MYYIYIIYLYICVYSVYSMCVYVSVSGYMYVCIHVGSWILAVLILNLCGRN